jgi:integrase/recombinase XerD
MDIHRREGVLDWITRKIVEETPPESREAIMRFDSHMLSRGLAAATRAAYLSHLYVIANQINKHFADATESDIVALLAYVEGNGYTAHVKEKYRRTIKSFWTWLGKPEYVENIRTMSKSQLYALCVPESILKASETRKIIDSGRNPYEKAIMSLAAETGARIGEILNLKTKSVQFDRIGARLVLNGKTGKRVVRIIKCKCGHPNLAVNLLRRVMDPGREYVFSKWNHITREHTRPSYQFVRHLFERVRAAHVTKKHVHAHIFRHTRATQLSPHLSYTQLCDYFGWQYGSSMPSIYIRANNSALDNALLEGYGMRPVRPEKLCLWC